LELAAKAEGWMQLDHPGGGSPCFLQSPKLGQRRGQLHVGDAVGGIGLNGLVGSAAGFVVAAEQEMAHCLCIERSECPRVEWTETHAALAPRDGALGFAGPAQDD